MPSGVERCACGAEIEINEAHYTQVVAFVNAWRKAHNCVNVMKEPEVSLISVDASRNETPMGFTRGMRVDVGDIDIDEDPENRKRFRK